MHQFLNQSVLLLFAVAVDFFFSPILSAETYVFRFNMCTQARLHHIAPSDYDDFVSIVCSARNAFCMVPGGMAQFNEMLQSLRRSKHCKKDLWQRVISGLHSTNNV